MTWPVPASLDDAQLEALLYPPIVAAVTVPLPDFAHLHRELSRPSVTRRLLWEEYQAQHSDGLQYSAFCDHYRAWRERSVEPVMRRPRPVTVRVVSPSGSVTVRVVTACHRPVMVTVRADSPRTYRVTRAA